MVDSLGYTAGMMSIGPELVWAMERADHFRAAGSERAAFAFHDPSILGTRLNLLVNADDGRLALAAAHRARREIDRLAGVFDWRDSESELSRLNRAREYAASPDLFTVVAAAERWREAAGGAFSGRLGRLLELWRGSAPPSAADAQRLSAEVAEARVELDATTGMINRPRAVRFDLDALAKGYIVDRALDAALAGGGVAGVLLDIGGDISCRGAAPRGGDWMVGLPDPLMIADNAPLIGRMTLRDRAVATSGCGPRDRTSGGEIYSATLDPRSGWPIAHRRSATAIAGCAMEADALATAMLVMQPDAATQLVSTLPGVSARLTRPEGEIWLSHGAGPVANEPPEWIPIQAQGPASNPSNKLKWHERWVAFTTFTAPPRQMKRDIAFRSPYVAIWVTDLENRPVRTLVLIGSVKEWQQDNYIWWTQHRAIAQNLIDSYSMSTRGSGEYKVLWDGTDQNGQAVAAGRYVLHVETSRERGKHTHRSLELDFSQAKTFDAELPSSEESGGLTVTFQRF